ncbi:MAG: glutathione peroxidase [Phycisphaerae bacterium]|nr:MAG: glutathione peroxidase [Phycisphaerae bacterium]
MKTAKICTMIAMFAGAQLLVAEEASKESKTTDETKMKTSVLDFEMKSISGEDVKLEKYRGDVLLIVNVASKCGLTKKNYEQLEPLYQKYKDKDFEILAFPANDFLSQEPGSNEEIAKFCEKYNVSFDLFSKVSVKGDDCCDLYKFLINHPNKDIAGKVKWNFQKYLVDRKGEVIAKFGPRTNPDSDKIAEAVEKALAEPKPEAVEK